MKDLTIDFGLPALILVMLFALILTGVDSEVKTLFATVIGWIVHGGVSRSRKK